MKLYVMAGLSAFFLSLLFCLVELPILRRVKAGQNVLKYVKEHEEKNGTPTMGGAAFVFAAAIVSLFLFGVSDRDLIVSVTVGIGFLVIGAADDLMKIVRRENQGLTAWQKLIFQTVVALLACAYLFLYGSTKVYLPLTEFSAELGWWIFPIGVFVFLGTVNGVNLTDGLDGLAGGTSAAYFLILGILLVLQDGFLPFSVLSFSLTGALLAYLIFNTHKASMFMGDTGSLSLGGFAACIAVFSGNLLYIPLIGGMFLLSSITVILQVIYYKKTGRRIFRMAPIHHHFQQKGYGESKIAYCYALITLVTGACVLLPFLS